MTGDDVAGGCDDGLMVVLVPAAAALGATVLNRFAITLVEAALLGGGVLGSRLRRSRLP